MARSRLGGDGLVWALFFGVGGFGLYKGVEEWHARHKAATTPTTSTPTTTPGTSAPITTTPGTSTTPAAPATSTTPAAPVVTTGGSTPVPTIAAGEPYSPQPVTPASIYTPAVQPDGSYLPAVMPIYTPDPAPVAAPSTAAAAAAAVAAIFQGGVFGGVKQPITTMPITSPALDAQPVPVMSAQAPVYQAPAPVVPSSVFAGIVQAAPSPWKPNYSTQPVYQTMTDWTDRDRPHRGIEL